MSGSETIEPHFSDIGPAILVRIAKEQNLGVSTCQDSVEQWQQTVAESKMFSEYRSLIGMAILVAVGQRDDP